MPRLRCLALLALLSCSTRAAPPAAPARSTALTGQIPVVTAATVIAFWLPAVDTLSEADRSAARADLEASSEMIAAYLSDTDIGLIATLKDTVVVQLASGLRRTLMLTGLDFPYGFVLVEPGFPEEYWTGSTGDEDLRAAIDDYFGLEDTTSDTPRHRIASTRPSPSVLTAFRSTPVLEAGAPASRRYAPRR